MVDGQLAHAREGAVPRSTYGPEFRAAASQGPRELVSPFALLMIGEAPAHGYALAAHLKDLGFDPGGAGSVYSHLRDLHRRGLLESSLTAGGFGPVRRTYALTASGRTALDGYAEGISGLRRDVVRLLAEADAPADEGMRRRANSPIDARQGVSLGHRSEPHRSDQGVGGIAYPREMILAGILIVLEQMPTDSTGIVSALTDLGIDLAGLTGMRTCLNSLAGACLVQRAQSGPPYHQATRVYELSPAGRLAMPAWLAYLQLLNSLLRRWSDRYARVPKSTQPSRDGDSPA